MTRTARIRDLLSTTARLIACMDQEIKLLRAMRPQEIQLLQVDKMALADAYEAHFMALRDSREDGEAVSEALLAELGEATERFQSVLAENALALKAVREVNDRVLKAIVDSVERNRSDAAGYTRTGTAPALRRRSRQAPALSVDQQL